LTSVLATHNPDLARRAQRILRLANGRLEETVVPIIQ
jgi:predicted ABC-type transport system involved in lysophospholipase L1 biosynthesis ATPase subunit